MYLCALKLIGMTGQKTPTALGTEKIGKLLMQYAIPAIIAMTASSLYNMVDRIFIGHGVGAMAISGLALTFPLMNLLKDSVLIALTLNICIFLTLQLLLNRFLKLCPIYIIKENSKNLVFQTFRHG